MRLQEFPNEFSELITLTAMWKHIPESAVERDYYIVMLLKNLADSQYAEQCVFKGGTSLSKCFPGSIERFSEDIDLTFLGMELSDKVCDRTIKDIEKIMTRGANTEKINAERSNRSKSMYVWFTNKANRVKLEIGSSVRPDPYSKKMLKTYIQEFLEEHNNQEDIVQFNLEAVKLNVLNIERTFIDKLMSVKRHALCGSLGGKVRHVYDVVRLYSMPEIKTFLKNKDELKRLLRLTKATDSFYLEKRVNHHEYNTNEQYNFEQWVYKLDFYIRDMYENLHKELLYTDEKQDWDQAIIVFTDINNILKEIEE